MSFSLLLVLNFAKDPIFKDLVIPLFTIIFGLVLKANSKRTPLVKEDFALGTDVYISGLLLYFIKLYDLANKNEFVSTSAPTYSIQTKYIISLLFVPVFMVVLFIMSNLIRVYAWKSTTELHWMGLIIPNIISFLFLIATVFWLNF